MKKNFAFILLLFLAVPFALVAQDPEVPVEPGLNIWTIVSGVLAVVAAIFGTALTKVKKKIGEFVDLARQAVELLTVVTDAIGDNTVTKEEIAAMKAEIADVKAAWRVLWNKV